MKCLLIVYSYHHNNTQKIAEVMAKVLDAEIRTPQQTKPEELQKYDLVGFGSGIYGGKHHKFLLDLADRLLQVKDKNAFIFSTSGAPISLSDEEKFDEYAEKSHLSIREKLQSKGYRVVDEFICAGYNTNSFLKLFGGINKVRPNTEDLKHAEDFAQKLKQKNSHA
jgi:flavodoxin